MQAIKKINNNTVVCVDRNGKQLIAMGRGLGFPQLPREISLAEIERTFYNISPQYVAAISELDPAMVDFAARITDGGALGGLYAGIMHVGTYVMGAANFLSVLGYVAGGTSNMVNGIIACLISLFGAAIATYMIGFAPADLESN